MRLNGELVYDWRWLRKDLRELRLEKIGFIFQSHNLLPFLNAWENIAIARILAGASPVQAKDRALELLAYLGIERRKDAMMICSKVGGPPRTGVRYDVGSVRPSLPKTHSSLPAGNLCKIAHGADFSL